MIYQDRNLPYFLCLCSDEHQPLLAKICDKSPHRVEFVNRVEDVLKLGLVHPPLALILEIATAIRFGPERMSRFLNLGVNWPVMRCAISPEGDARVMCFEPAHGEPLLAALQGIAKADPAWTHPRFHRRHLRLNIPGRVRVRVLGEETLRRGNLQGISCGGCFVALGGETPPIDAPVELEFVDFDPPSLAARGTVAWSRSWEDGVELPGVGIEFDPATIGEAFREFIVRGPQLSELIAEP